MGSDLQRPQGRRRCLGALAAALASAGSGASRAAWGEAPPPLCGTGAPPPYPPPDKSPLVQTWMAGRQDGPAPDCGGLRSRDVELLVRLTGSFAAPGDLDAMALRLGAVSLLKGLPYWSFSDRKRLVLFKDAFAVDSPGSVKPRADFSLAELRRGEELYFVHNDNRSNTLHHYAMRLVPAGADSVSLRIENLDDIRYMGLTMVGVRELQWAVSVERLPNGRWGYRSLMGLHRMRLGGADKHRLSNLARSVALFDLLAGQQSDIEYLR